MTPRSSREKSLKRAVLDMTLACAVLLTPLGGCTVPEDGAKAAEPGLAVEEAFPGRRGELRQGVFDTSTGPRELHYELIDGVAVFEGDIILPLDREHEASERRALGTVRSKETYRWPNGVVAYTLDPALPNTARVTDAIAHWEAHSSIRFVARTSQTDYVTFRPGTGCSSSVGRLGGQQFITLESGCSTGNTIHEIGHALGLWHEQSRTDRDNHVTIHWENILAGKEHNFKTYVQRGYDGRNSGPYDLSSIMHYPSNGFSSNGLPTITRLDGTTFSANRTAVTDTDVCTVQRFYGYGRGSDINGDGYADLVIGVPYEDIGTGTNQGAISVIFGEASGLGTIDQLLHRDTSGVEDVAGDGDLFGWAVAVGDFNGDCRADVAVGVPYDDVNGVTNAGSVHVFYGTFLGLGTSTDAVFHQGQFGAVEDLGVNDLFGHTLRAGDFNGDGYEDLAVGVPYEDVGSITDAGAVNILYGSASGLSTVGVRSFSQNTRGVADSSEAYDNFGFSLAAADFNRDGFVDLAVGVPNEDDGSTSDTGGVHVLHGSVNGLVAGSQLWREGAGTIPGTPEVSGQLGYALAAGDFNGDGIGDLVMGKPGAHVGSVADAGSITAIYGSTSGLVATGAQLWTQSSSIIIGLAEEYDRFGRALVAEDFNGDGYDDLAVGVPYEDVGALNDAGSVNVLYGGPAGVAAGGNQSWTQDSTNVEGVAEDLDKFGFRLAAGDYNGDGKADLAVAVPYEAVGSATNAGAVNILYSAGASGLSSAGDQILYQGSFGLQDTAEAYDYFGFGL